MFYDSRRPLPSIQQSTDYKHPFALEHETSTRYTITYNQFFVDLENEKLNLIERENS